MKSICCAALLKDNAPDSELYRHGFESTREQQFLIFTKAITKRIIASTILQAKHIRQFIVNSNKRHYPTVTRQVGNFYIFATSTLRKTCL